MPSPVFETGVTVGNKNRHSAGKLIVQFKREMSNNHTNEFMLSLVTERYLVL